MSKYIPVDWRQKYNDRSTKVKAIEKRVREVTNGREKWKAKYKKVKSERDTLKHELNNIKKKISSIMS